MHIPVLQSVPFHPELQLHVPGFIQVPPLLHPCEQIAIKYNKYHNLF